MSLLVKSDFPIAHMATPIIKKFGIMCTDILGIGTSHKEMVSLSLWNDNDSFRAMLSSLPFLVYSPWEIVLSCDNFSSDSGPRVIKSCPDINFSVECFLLCSHPLCFFSLLTLMRVSVAKSKISLGKYHIALKNMWATFKYLLITDF